MNSNLYREGIFRAIKTTSALEHQSPAQTSNPFRRIRLSFCGVMRWLDSLFCVLTKTKFAVFGICWLFVATVGAGAQVLTQLQVLPPYSPYLADYTSRTNAMIISVTNS